jgi:hypothetical protein
LKVREGEIIVNIPELSFFREINWPRSGLVVADIRALRRTIRALPGSAPLPIPVNAADAGYIEGRTRHMACLTGNVVRRAIIEKSLV